MSGALRLNGGTSGYSQISAADVAGDQTFMLPENGGTLATTANNSVANIGGYQAGVWTPVVVTETALFSDCNWHRIGNAVTVFGAMGKPTSSANATLEISGLPYNNSSSGIAGNVFGRYVSLPSSGQAFTATYIGLGNLLTFYSVSTGEYEVLRYADLASASSQIYFMANYRTADTTWQPINGATVS